MPIIGTPVSSPTCGPSAGAYPITWTLTVDSQPLTDADVWLTRDINGTQIIDRKRSDTNGQVRFLADKFVPGTTDLITYYGWAQKDGVVSVQAETLTCD